MNLLLSKLKSHTSFLILLASALSLFLISVILKKHITAEEYGKMSLLFTFISLIYSFSLLGLEQVFLRLSKYENNILNINRKIIYVFFLIFFISTLTFSYLMKHYYPEVSNIKIMFLVSVCIISMFGYNIYRLIKQFNLSQIIANSWKILLLISTLFIYTTISFIDVFNIIMYSMLLISIICLIYYIKKLKIHLYDSNETFTMLWVNFAFSMIIISFINYSDRYLIEYYLGIEEVGIYFYYLTVILFPYMLFQNYFGFKELPEFKNNFSIEILHKKILKVMLFSFILTIILLVMFLIINNINYLDEFKINNYLLMFILMASGIIKIVYSILSAAIGATAKSEVLKECNFYTLIVISILIYILYVSKNISIEYIATLYLIINLFRLMIYYYGVRKVQY